MRRESLHIYMALCYILYKVAVGSVSAMYRVKYVYI